MDTEAELLEKPTRVADPGRETITMQASPQRLYSLDALRGFDMFWIMGADLIVRGFSKATGSPFWAAFSTQVVHPPWHGFSFYDLIFPLFLFLAGVATPYSVGRELEKGRSRTELLGRIIKRGIVLILLGMVVNQGLHIMPVSEIRFASVLGRIGVAYMLANIIYLYARDLYQVAWFGFFLVGYWLLLKFSSAPGFPAGDLSMEGNFASYMDRVILPGKLYKVIHDPEGLFSTIPAISTALLGIFSGKLLKNPMILPQKKALYLALGGIISLVLGQIWSLDFPINKNLWTSSFVLHVGGFSLLLLALFYYVIDVLGYKKWAFFFKVIGMNSILIYISGIFINWNYTNEAFFGWLGQLAGEPFNIVIMAACYLFIKWLFLYILYRKKVFLRV